MIQLQTVPGCTGQMPVGGQQSLVSQKNRKIFSAAIALLVACLPILMSGCAEEQAAEKIQRTVIHGRITNPSGTNASVRIADTIYSTELDAEGRFSLIFDLQEAGYARFRIGPEYTIGYLQPGDSLQLSLDATQFDLTLTYGGTSAAINNYLAAKMVRKQGLDGEENAFLLDEAAFVQHQEKIRSGLLADLEGSALDEEFTTRERVEINFAWANDRASYPEAYAYYAENPEFKPSETYWDFVKELDLNNDWNATSNNFTGFASRYLAYKAADGQKDITDPAALSLNQMDLVEANFTNPAVRSVMYGSVLEDYLSEYGADGATPIFDRYIASAGESVERKKLEKLYYNWQELSAGKPAPGFSGKRLDGSAVALSDLKGKTVYVDVWATWCGPCRAELPYLETLQKEFEGNDNVVLMSISVDDNKEDWEQMVTEKSLGGLQIFTEGAWQSEVITRYLIDGIPRFMIIGPDGTISDAQAPRPSSGEVGELLRQVSGAPQAQS